MPGAFEKIGIVVLGNFAFASGTAAFLAPAFHAVGKIPSEEKQKILAFSPFQCVGYGHAPDFR
jgi:hypothetical protein